MDVPLRLHPIFAIFIALHAQISNAQIPLKKSYVGQEFMDGFYFFTDPDPANGVVQYVDSKTAKSDGLVSWTDSVFMMRADDKKIANLGPGRESVRLVSNDLFGDGVYIFDVDHIPLGCGTWPAAWTTTVKNWPYAGEIDIIEGANSLGNHSIPAAANPSSSLVSTPISNAEGPSSPITGTTPETFNVVSLHTSPNCPMSSANTSTLSTMTGTVKGQDCSGLSPGNVGCGVEIPGPSFGVNFNNVGGGIYAMWRDLKNTSSVHTWFWDRSIDPPADVKNLDSATVDPSKWGTAAASMVITNDCSNLFMSHAIVLNIDFCGGYGESTFNASGCPGDCQTFVRYYPEAFKDAFFQFRSVRVYTNGAGCSHKIEILAVVFLVFVGLVLL